MNGTWYYYGYNDEGVRVYKNGGAYYHNYTVDGTKVIVDRWYNNELVYLYDANGSPIGMQYRNASMAENVFYTYWFEKNLQGDIIAIYNDSGVKLITYAYDAWGLQTRTVLNSSGTNIYAQYNCLTYRGYFYDQETGLYYLNSRYYNPVTKRFINADGCIGANKDLFAYNLFAYCSNNPIKYADFNGLSASEILKGGWTLGGIISQLDSPVPGIADVIGLAIGIGSTIIAGVVAIPWEDIGESVSDDWEELKTKTKEKTKSISREISKAVSKAKIKIKSKKQRYDYWIAGYVNFGENEGTFIPTVPLSLKQASSYVRSGGSVFANSRGNAYKLANAISFGGCIRHPAHGEIGYYPHYHATIGGIKVGGHIFYVPYNQF